MEKIDLRNVTLVCVDTADENRAIKAMLECNQYCHFHEKLLFGVRDGITPDDIQIITITKLRGKNDYSRFILKELYTYIQTPFVMICQYDGYIINPEAWDPAFLNYDYIGAPWWYKDENNVGNGGFCIRSKRLMETVATFGNTDSNEDHMICRVWGPVLKVLGFTFAPESIAERFSWESNPLHQRYQGSFGYHGGVHSKEFFNLKR